MRETELSPVATQSAPAPTASADGSAPIGTPAATSPEPPRPQRPNRGPRDDAGIPPQEEERGCGRRQQDRAAEKEIEAAPGAGEAHRRDRLGGGETRVLAKDGALELLEVGPGASPSCSPSMRRAWWYASSASVWRPAR
jgi:hypothetical protein